MHFLVGATAPTAPTVATGLYKSSRIYNISWFPGKVEDPDLDSDGTDVDAADADDDLFDFNKTDGTDMPGGCQPSWWTW